MEEKIAWSKTLFSLQREDLLLLWSLIPNNHLLFEDFDLCKIFRERIDAEGGFKLV